MRILVTGGAGFIGSAVVRQFILQTDAEILNLDCLTYAGNVANVAAIANDPRYRFAQIDIRDYEAVSAAFGEFQPDGVMHLAAESHVDRSIDGPRAFLETNVVGTYNMLEAARGYWDGLDAAAREAFRFLHVSTDEVYGELGPKGCSRKPRPISPAPPIRQPRRLPIIW